MRKSAIYLAFMALCGGLFFVLASMHPLLVKTHYQRAMDAKKALVRALDLTDLCLFFETRYTRHLSQADRHSALQDHPMALDHFPSGSFVMPPRFLYGPHNEKN